MPKPDKKADKKKALKAKSKSKSKASSKKSKSSSKPSGSKKKEKDKGKGKPDKDAKGKSDKGKTDKSKNDKSKNDKSKNDKAKAADKSKSEKPANKDEPPKELTKEAKANREAIDKIIELLRGVRPEQVTKNNKDDLDKIQTMIKNIQYRDAGESSRVREVVFTEQQKAVIKMVAGIGVDEEESKMALTESPSGGATVAKAPAPPPKITMPFQKLELVPTKS